MRKKAKPKKSASPDRERILDGLVMFIAIPVETLSVILCMTSMVQHPAEKIAFGGVGLVVSLFGIRAYLKGPGVFNKVVWALFSLASVYLIMSLTLASIGLEDGAVEFSASDDPVVVQLQIQAEGQRAILAALGREFALASRPATIESIQRRQAQAEEALLALNDRILERITAIASGELKQDVFSRLNSRTIFGAIPSFLSQGRGFEVVFFLVIFAGMVLTNIIAATKIVRTSDGPVIDLQAQEFCRLRIDTAGPGGELLPWDKVKDKTFLAFAQFSAFTRKAIALGSFYYEGPVLKVVPAMTKAMLHKQLMGAVA